MTRFSCAAVVILGFGVLGCHPLPPGDIHAVARPPAEPRAGRVYLIRGWRDLWSQGIDQFANELRDRQVDAQVFRATQWRELAAAIDKSPPAGPLILIGFSYGADDAIETSRKLHRPVNLVVAIDPVTPPAVPANVLRCYDYYETNGVWDLFPWLRGIPLKSDAPSNLVNVDLRKSRPDLVEADLSHSTIASNARLHREILERIVEVLPRRASAAPEPRR